MCVAPATSEFEEAVIFVQQHSQTIKEGKATALTYYKRGSAYQQLRALEAALRDYDAALNCTPPLETAQLAALHDNRNTCLRQLSRYGEAIAAGMEAVRLMPDHARYHTNLGFVRYWSQDFDAALADLNCAIELDNDESWAYGYRGMIYTLNGNPEKAIEDFSYVINPGGAMALLFLWRAQAYYQVGQYENAEIDCSSAIEISKYDDWRLWAQRGWSRYQQNKLVDALGDFNESISMQPNHYSYLGRALVFRALGAGAAAEVDTAKYVKLHPQGAIAAFQEMAFYLRKREQVAV